MAPVTLPWAQHSVSTRVVGVTECILGRQGQHQRGKQRVATCRGPPPGGPQPGGAVPSGPHPLWRRCRGLRERHALLEHVLPRPPFQRSWDEPFPAWRLPCSWPSRVSDSLGQKPWGHGVTLLRYPVPAPPQDPGGQELLLTSSCLGPAGQAWRTGLGGGPAPSLPLRSSCLQCLTFSSNLLFSALGSSATSTSILLSVKNLLNAFCV